MANFGKKRGGGKKDTSPRGSGVSGAGGARGPQPVHHGGPPSSTRVLAPPGFAGGGIRNPVNLLHVCTTNPN